MKSENIIPSKHEVIRNEKGQFVKGSSGNPGGRPAKNLSELLKNKVNETTEAGNVLTNAEMIINKAIDLAINGDIQAIKWIFERIDGRPIPMRIDLIQEHKPIRILDIGFTDTLKEIAEDEVIVIEKDGTERIEKKKEYATFIVE